MAFVIWIQYNVFLTEPLLTKIKDLLCDFKQDRGLLGVNLS